MDRKYKILVADDDPDFVTTLREMLHAGAEEFVQKPYDIGSLVAKIKTHLQTDV